MSHNAATVVSLSLLLGACGPSTGTVHGGGGSGGNGGSVGGVAGSGGSGGMMGSTGPVSDFPTTPVVDPGGSSGPAAPSSAPTLFGASDDGSAGPCLLDPQDGSLLPGNWLRPRFAFSPAAASQNLFEIRLHTANEINDLVVYTMQRPWTLDAVNWKSLHDHIVDQPITVTVRAATWDGSKLTAGPTKPTSATFTIAPVEARGSIVYWTANKAPVVTALKGFSIGDEGVHTIVDPTAISGTQPACIGCHTATPDGSYTAFSWTADPDNGDVARVMLLSTDGKLSAPPTTVVAASAGTQLNRAYQQFPSFSTQLWNSGSRVMISTMQIPSMSTYGIYWTDLGTGMSQQLSITGDPSGRYPGNASFSHSGKSIVYASGSPGTTGYQMTNAQLRVVPYNGGNGGASNPLLGASDADKNQFFGAYSDDDKWIAFTRIDNTTDSNLQNGLSSPKAQVFVVPATGGTATKLAANDAPSCLNLPSPGVGNSWPKWAPDSTPVGSKTYYWVTFSSKRNGITSPSDVATNKPQLYVTPLVFDGDKLTTYPALYLWNQPAGEGNLTPAWTNISIPIT